MTKVVVCGIAGRMGQRLGNLICDDDEMQLVGATERPGHEALGRDVGDVLGRGTLGATVTDFWKTSMYKEFSRILELVLTTGGKRRRSYTTQLKEYFLSFLEEILIFRVVKT